MKAMGVTDRDAFKRIIATVEEMEQALETVSEDVPERYVELLRQHDTTLANLLYERGAEILTAPAYALVATAIYSHLWRCENNSELPSRLTEGALRLTQATYAEPITPVKFYPRGGKVSFVTSIRVQDITDAAERAMMLSTIAEAHVTYLLTQSQYANLIIRLYGENSTLPALTIRVVRHKGVWEAQRAGNESNSILSRREELLDLLYNVIPAASSRDRGAKVRRRRVWEKLKLPTRSPLSTVSMSLLSD